MNRGGKWGEKRKMNQVKVNEWDVLIKQRRFVLIPYLNHGLKP